MHTIIRPLLIFLITIFVNQSNGTTATKEDYAKGYTSAIDRYDTLALWPYKSPDDFSITLENLVKKPWDQFLPSVGSQGMYLEKMQVHRPGSKSVDAFGKSSHDDFVVIRNVPDELFKKAGKPYFWGMISNLNNRPFIAVRFKVQKKDSDGQWKDIDNRLYSIALSYITYKVTRTNLGKALEKTSQKIVNKGRTDVRDTQEYSALVTSGGDGAYYLGQYDVRTTDVTAEDMRDMAKLIATGSVERTITIPGKDPKKGPKERVKLILAP